MGKVLSCLSATAVVVLAEAAKQEQASNQAQAQYRRSSQATGGAVMALAEAANRVQAQSQQSSQALRGSMPQQSKPVTNPPARRVVSLQPQNDWERLLLSASQSMTPHERAIIEKFLFDSRYNPNRPPTSEEQAICARVLMQHQQQTNQMVGMCMNAASGTQQMAGSIGNLRKNVLHEGLRREEERQQATAARIDDLLSMRYDPEASGYNDCVRMHNQNVLDQAYAYNIGQGFHY